METYDEFVKRFLEDGYCPYSPEEIESQPLGPPLPTGDPYDWKVIEKDYEEKEDEYLRTCQIFDHHCPGGEEKVYQCTKVLVKRVAKLAKPKCACCGKPATSFHHK